MSSDRDRLGGIIHTYQKYDPVEFPSPTAEPPDLVKISIDLGKYGRERLRRCHASCLVDGME